MFIRISDFAEGSGRFLIDAFENARDDFRPAFRELFHEVLGEAFHALDFGIGFPGLVAYVRRGLRRSPKSAFRGLSWLKRRAVRSG